MNPGRRAVPDRPAHLVDYLGQVAGEQYSIAPGEVFRRYAYAALERDPGLAAQLREALGKVPAPVRAALRARRPAGAVLDGRFGSPGEFMQAVWHRADPEGRQAIRNSFSEDDPAGGGFLLPEEMRSDIVLLSLESAIVRPRATVFPVTGYYLKVPAVDDKDHSAGTLPWLTAEWLLPGEEIDETSGPGSFASLMLEPANLKAFATVDNELLEDAAAFSVWWHRAVPEATAWYEDQAFLTGDGAGRPLGLVNSSAAIEVTRAADSHITFGDIPAMLARLLPQSLDRAVWICSQTALIDMLSVYQNFGSATEGVIPPSMWVEHGPGGWTLMGMPLCVTEHVPQVGDTGDLVLADLSYYVVADREMVTLETSPHPEFQADKTALRMRHRVNGRTWLSSPVTPENGSATLSPVVILGPAS